MAFSTIFWRLSSQVALVTPIDVVGPRKQKKWEEKLGKFFSEFVLSENQASNFRQLGLNQGIFTNFWTKVRNRLFSSRFLLSWIMFTCNVIWMTHKLVCPFQFEKWQRNCYKCQPKKAPMWTWRGLWATGSNQLLDQQIIRRMLVTLANCKNYVWLQSSPEIVAKLSLLHVQSKFLQRFLKGSIKKKSWNERSFALPSLNVNKIWRIFWQNFH